MATTKYCTGCRKTKPLTLEFFPWRTDRSQFAARCIDCKNAWWRLWRSRTEEYRERTNKKKREVYHAMKDSDEYQIRDRARRLGVSPEDIRAVWSNWKCAICGESQERLEIDHDHKTGKVRGLLCGYDNKMLGHAKDDPSRLRKGAEYLESFMKA